MQTKIQRDPEVAGLSPKAYFPALVGLAVGIMLIVIAAATGDSVLQQIGIGILVAALGHFGIAYASPVGDVKVKPEVIEKVVEKVVHAPAPAPERPAKKPAARKPAAGKPRKPGAK